MSLLENKRILITGISSNRSIAYGIAKACLREGASLTLTYNNERFKERVQGFANEFNAGEIVKLDVSSDDSIAQCQEKVALKWPEGLDGLVHSIAWAPREGLEGKFIDGISREGFLSAMNISVYSFPALVKAFASLLIKSKGSVITMTYLGSERIVPNYNTMGVAKAALEACVRYLAADLGPEGVRVNSVSSGPIKTLAASGIKDFSALANLSKTLTPLRSLMTTEEVGNLSAYLLSDYSAGITAENIYIDGGFNKMAAIASIEE
ncbi:MAG: enoyl-ACP reductase [Burkholderiales bacterium]|nr:enoyl-ACP reductase [Burkholderiales bacterium]